MSKALESTQREIMQLMVSIAQKDRAKSMEKLVEIKEMILDGLDHTVDDEELVRWSRFLKIIGELELKITD